MTAFYSEIYVANGYKDRIDYLLSLAMAYGLPFKTVRMLADMLGDIEDFDGLISHLNELEFNT